MSEGDVPAPGLVAEGARHESPWTPLLLALCLVLAFVLRLPGLDEPWSGKGFNAGIGAWTTGECAQNFVHNGFFEAGLLPNRWRIELPDGTVEREWYAHHPAAFVLLSAVSLKVFGDEGPSEWTIRLPWLFISVAAVWALFRFLVLVWGERAALLGAYFMAVLPLAAHYSLLPWVDTNAMPLVYALFLRRYVLWLRNPGPRTIFPCALWAFLGGMLDWNMHFLLAFVGVHALVCVLRRGGGWSALREFAWVPAAAVFSIVVHALHMYLVMPWEAMTGDTSATWGRTTTNTHEWSEFFGHQWRHVLSTLTPVATFFLGLGLLRQLGLGLAGRLNREEWLWPALLLPGFAYVTAFPFRGVNHEFMIALSLPWFAGTLGLEALWVARLFRRTRALQVTVLAILVLGLGYVGVRRTLEMWGATRSIAVSKVAEQEWFQSRFADPRAVGVTSRGQSWMLLYYARTPIVPRINSVAQLEGLRTRILSRLEPDRPVYFLFDRQFQGVERELYEYLKASGPSEEHLEGLKADPMVVFEVFDLTSWAHEAS